NQFQGNYALTIQGDQQASPNDVITVSDAFGGVDVTLNGELVEFDPGTITSIVVEPGGGDNIVNVEGTLPSVPVTIDMAGDKDGVHISPAGQNLDNIQGNVTINNNSGELFLDVNDQNDPKSVSWDLEAGRLTRDGAATISYTALDDLDVNGGGGANDYAFFTAV